MQIQFKTHVRVICDLEIGQQVTTDFHTQSKNKIRIIEDIKPKIGYCESGFLVKATGLDWIDSNWFEKV